MFIIVTRSSSCHGFQNTFRLLLLSRDRNDSHNRIKLWFALNHQSFKMIKKLMLFLMLAYIRRDFKNYLYDETLLYFRSRGVLRKKLQDMAGYVKEIPISDRNFSKCVPYIVTKFSRNNARS